LRRVQTLAERGTKALAVFVRAGMSDDSPTYIGLRRFFKLDVSESDLLRSWFLFASNAIDVHRHEISDRGLLHLVRHKRTASRKFPQPYAWAE